MLKTEEREKNVEWIRGYGKEEEEDGDVDDFDEVSRGYWQAITRKVTLSVQDNTRCNTIKLSSYSSRPQNFDIGSFVNQD